MRVPSETEKAVLGIVEMMKALTEKVENMDNHLPEKVLASMKPAIHAEVNAQLDERLVTVHEKIANLEDAVKNITDRLKAGENVERANSNARCSDEATSKAMSWMVQKKATSQDDFPIQCVVKNAKKVSQKTEKVTENNGLDCKEIQKPEVPHQDIVRQGNSTVKRIISGVTQSVTVYDPFAVVDESLYAKLLDFMQPDDMEPIATWDTNVEFYKVIITPRIHWPNNTYGWLTTSHLCAAMLMFHKRSMRTPSPYYSSWITFLNQWFVNTWVRDYKTFDPKTWIIPDKYRGVFNGTYPVDSVTNKKWITDVDHVFACHFINDNHWIALDIDLVKEKINVYDSIITMVMDDKDILNFCRPFTRMIPAMLNAMIPSRKKSDKQFLAKRLKSIPQNNDPGDCGVYTLKYIECLALGCSFDGLSDRNIQALRHKLAAEILDEVGEPGMSMSISLPDGKLGLRDSE
ncbi:unnamed protein product [Thlaspi arvense]|uniref:Ubiquitin-like protease family profile domain-containing protein n=1 Tax=Thlaspi arvense TaxID=13288 RepID=A0AAU9SV81_THLAR|nr:unnamed protein product [Thlaspi arvense]